MSSGLKDFVRKIIVVDIGLLLSGGIIALFLKLDFGMILLALGILSSVVGGYLGGPNRYEPKDPWIWVPSFLKQPPLGGEFHAWKLHSVKSAVPFYAFENVLLFAGLIAIVISLLVLF